MNIIIYNRNNINLITKIKYLWTRKYTIYYWKRSDATKYDGELIPFPKSSKYQELRSKAQYTLNSYFTEVQQGSGISQILIDYIKKIVSPGFIDYYMFNYSVNVHKIADSIVVQDDLYSKILMKNRNHNNFKRIIFLFEAIIKYILHILTALSTMILFKGNETITEVIYIRKQVKPDILNFELLESYFKKNRVQLSKIYPTTNRLKVKYDMLFINAFRVAPLILYRSILRFIKYAIKDLILLIKSDMYCFVQNSLVYDMAYMLLVVELRGKVYFGFLADKAKFILLYKYKYSDQILAIIPDGINFKGTVIAADYFYGDIGFYSDSIAVGGLNINGGDIKNIIYTGSLYTNLKSTTGVVSKDILSKVVNYKCVILVLSAQFNSTRDSYSYYKNDYLEIFLDKLYELSIKHDQCMFILKEKKNEFADENISRYPENVSIVRTKDPKLMLVNHFIDLLTISNIIITLSPNSSVIPQAVLTDVLPISYTQYKIPTPWSKYKYLDVDLSNIDQSIEYWTNNLQSISSTNNIIKSDFMLDKNFLKVISGSICKRLV
jgi:hypothetical protein